MQVEQMPYGSWCAIKSKEEWEFFKQIHKGSGDLNGQDTLMKERGRVLLHRLGSFMPGSICFRTEWLESNQDLIKSTPEYKLPIPEGWRLADKGKDSKIHGWRIYDQFIKKWQEPCKDPGDFVEGGVYAVPDKPIAKQEPPMFPAKHYFINTEENRKAFAEKFPTMKWITGEDFDATDAKYYDAIGHGYTHGESSPTTPKAMTYGKESIYTDDGFTRYYFDHEKEESAPVSPEVFPDNHWFENTPENVKEFLRRFPNEKSVGGNWVNSDWLGVGGYRYFIKESTGRFARGIDVSYSRKATDGRVEFVFEHQKAKPKAEPEAVAESAPAESKFKAGDIAAVAELLLGDCPQIGDLIEVVGIKPGKKDCILYMHKGVEKSAHKNKFRHATEAEKLSRFKVGDIVVVTDSASSGASYENGTIGKVTNVSSVNVEVDDGKSVCKQFFIAESIRHATEGEKLAFNGSKWHEAPEPAGESPLAPVIAWLDANGETVRSWAPNTTTESQGSITISPVTSAAQASGATTSDGEEADMLTQSEKDEILALVRGAKSSNGNVAGKTVGFAGKAARGLLKWAIAPAKPVGRIALKLVQYAVFFAGAGAGAYSAYYAYNHAGNFMPFEIRMKQEDPSPSDDVKARQITDFVRTGGINT